MTMSMGRTMPLAFLILGFLIVTQAVAQPIVESSVVMGPVVMGRVLGAAGEGLVGARVALLPIPSNHQAGQMQLRGLAEPPPIAATESGSDGRFQLRAPAAGVFRLVVKGLVVKGLGFVPMHYQPLALVEDVQLPPVVLRSDQGLRVQVRSADGRPLEGSWVVAAQGDDSFWLDSRPLGWAPSPRLGRTGPLGRVLLPRAAGERLSVTAAGPGTPSRTRGGIEALTATLKLASGTRRPIVVRGDDGQPLEGVLVRVGDPAMPVGLSGPDGRIDLAMAPGQRAHLRLTTADGRHGSEELGHGSEGTGPRVIVLPAPTRLEGRILDAVSRQPVAGALVWTGVDPGTFARTDANGRYQLVGPAASRFWVQAEAPGYMPRLARVGKTDLSAGRLPSLALMRPASLAGRVVDGKGAAIVGAQLLAVPARSERRPFFRPDRADARAVSDLQGVFRLDRLTPEATYAMRVDKSGFATETRTVGTVGRSMTNHPLEVVLLPGRGVFGRVVDGHDRPIVGAVVQLEIASSTGGFRRFQVADRGGDDPFAALTDAEGRFEIAAVPASEVDVVVEKDDAAPMRVRAVTIDTGEGPLDLGTFVLVAGARLAGRVVDAAGEAIRDAAIHIVKVSRKPIGPEELRLRRRDPDAVSGAQGRFVLDDLIAGELVSLVVYREGYASAWMPRLVAPSERPVDVVLGRAAGVGGRITDAEDQPIPGAEITVAWRAILAGSSDRLPVGDPVSEFELSDRDGRFEITGFAAGDATVSVFAEGFVPAEPRDVRIAPGVERSDLTFRLERGAVVEGRVVTTEGEPVAGARVMAGRPAAFSDAEGAYRIEGVPFGRIAFEALHLDYGRQTEEVEIVPGTQTLDWTFERGKQVSGRVVDEEGAVVAGARVELVEVGGESRAYSGRSAGDGRFQLSPVASGRYRLSAAKPGYAETARKTPVVVADAALEELEIVLARGAAIAGRIIGLDFEQLGRVRIQAMDEQERTWRGNVDHLGHYRIADLAPGTWLVRAALDFGQRYVQERLTVSPGTREIVRDLEFGGGVTLSGEVLHNGSPLSDASIALVAMERSLTRSLRTDYSGAFRFDDTDPGVYRLELNSAREMLAHNQRVNVDGDRHLVLAFGTAKVRGQVIDRSTYQPIADAVVVLRHVVDETGFQPEGMIAGGSNAEGFFEMPRVPEGLYRLEARKDGFAPGHEEIRVDPGHDVVGLEVALAPTRGLDLVVRLASGKLPTQANLLALAPDGRVIVQGSRMLDAEGQTRFPTVPSGSWEILVGAPDAVHERRTVVVPGAPETVVLGEAGRLRVRLPGLLASDLNATVQLIGPDGRFLEAMDAGGSLGQAWSAIGGRAMIEGIPPGRWRVQATAPDGRSWSATVEVLPRRTAELVLE